jgi:TP901 family phage tail tape measure protein
VAVADTARLIAELSLDDKLSPKVKKALGSVDRLESGIGRIGRGAGQMSAGLARAGTRIAAFGAVALGGTAKAAIDWQDAFAGVVKTVNEADLSAAGLSLRDIELGLRNLATEMPNTAQELALIAEQAGAMGIAGKDILAFTKQVAILSSTTNVSAEEAAVALGQLQNVIGLTGDEFDNFSASLVDLGNKGNSTESQILEIARRAGGAAKLFGIAKEETLGWAAAAANLGLNEELAGTALQNVFVKLLPKYTKGAKDLQAVTGQTAAQLKKSFKEDAGGAIEDLIAQLGAMPKDKRLAAVQDLFGKGSGITRLVLGLAESYEKNLAPSIDTATQSWEEATAAQIEFEKRNATVKSAFARLRNGIIDAAISVGEGFVPALGRASDKLSAFLKQGGNRAALEDLGKKIGDAIDKIDWAEVLRGAQSFADVMKVAFDWATRLFGVLNALPTEIKAAGAGFLALNQLSGGLIGGGLGNIVGGALGPVIRNLGASLPGVGKAFVQPVFVTNMPVGGLGGAAGAAGKAGGVGGAAGFLMKAIPIASIVASVAAVVATQQDESGKNTAHAAEIKAGLDASIAGKTLPELRTALSAVDTGIERLQSNPLHALVQGEALTSLQSMRSDLTEQIGKLDRLRDQADRTKDDTVAATERVKTAAQETKRETTRGASQTSAATRNAGVGIEAAVRASRDNWRISVTNNISATGVTSTSVKAERAGGPAAGTDARAGTGMLGGGGP